MQYYQQTVVERAKEINFPPMYGLSKHHSPRLASRRESTTFKQHFMLTLGECTQAEYKPDRDINNVPHVLYCAHLRLGINHYLVYDLLHLQVYKIINHKKAQSAIVAEAIINQAQVPKALDDIPKGLHIKCRSGRVFWASIWDAKASYDSD